MRIYGIVLSKVYDHYTTKSIQTGMFGYDVANRYREWGKEMNEPSSPAKRVAFILVQIFKCFRR